MYKGRRLAQVTGGGVGFEEWIHALISYRSCHFAKYKTLKKIGKYNLKYKYILVIKDQFSGYIVARNFLLVQVGF